MTDQAEAAEARIQTRSHFIEADRAISRPELEGHGA
jgi:hypothetical protein